MFDPEERVVLDDYNECLGLDDYLVGKDFGRDRGMHPEPTDSQAKAVEKLASKLYTRPPKYKNKDKEGEEDNEDIVEFELMDAPRVILFDGKVLKKSLNALVNHTSTRHMFLLNDIIIVTSYQNTSSKKISILKMSDKYAIHQALPLDRLSLHCRSSEEPDEPCAFELHTPERVYTIIADSESDKRIWLEEIELALFAWHSGSPKTNEPGWQHELILGSLYSDAFLGKEEDIKTHIANLTSADGDIDVATLDAVDSSGMNCMHWACMRGHLNVVKLLLSAGCEVDPLNNGLNSPLLIAASKGFDNIIRVLLDHGADVTLRNLKDRDALFMAALYGHRSRGFANTLQMLHFNNIDFDQLDSTGSAPLHECAARNLPRAVRLLVSTAAKVNTKHGRTGVTPLQLACSMESPDVETIRSFLDNGAHPNWKDASGRSAFNMVLTAHSSDSSSKPSSPGPGMSGEQTTTDDGDMQERVQQYGMWVLQALPVLLEIVRKGGRYTEDSIAGLRDSFKEAIDSARLAWISAHEPENFDEFIEARGSMASTENWVENGASDHCLLCVDKFTYSNRRHHCRCCGTLCCAPCSAKRLRLIPGGSKGGERVCDGCFNKLSCEAVARNMAMAKAKKELILQLERDEKEALLHGSSMNAGSATEGDGEGTNDRLEDLKDVLAGTGEALKERGEKLATTAEKSAKMEEAAADFSKMTKQLLNQQQERAAGPSWRRSSSKKI